MIAKKSGNFRNHGRDSVIAETTHPCKGCGSGGTLVFSIVAPTAVFHHNDDDDDADGDGECFIS